MAKIYSTYEAKARFSEILRRVREGDHITISYRGRAVAEIRPIYRTSHDEHAVVEMEERGVLGRAAAPGGRLEPAAKRPGALQRFLESRD